MNVKLSFRLVALKPLLGWLVGFLLVGCAYLATYHFHNHASERDPDHFYHLALSRLTAEHGVIHSLPQVEELRWGESFPDKEFLFHMLTGGAYRLAGEPGVMAVIPVLALLFLASLAWFVARSTRCTPLVAWASVALMVIGSTQLMPRLLILRPHLLAMVLFVWIVYAGLERKHVLAGIFCALFALAYHMFYIPLLVLGVFACFDGRRLWQFKPLVYGVAGTLMGILANPYFPESIVMSWRQFLIATGYVHGTGIELGSELLALSWQSWLRAFGAQGVVFVVGCVGLLRRKPWNNAASYREPGVDRVLVLGLSALGIFLIMAMQSPRTIEYSTTVAVPVFAAILLSLPNNPRWIVAALMLCWQIPYLLNFYSSPVAATTAQQTRDVALSLIPENVGAKKVFNCEFSSTPQILYHRPEMRFLDILDPSFLFMINRPAHDLREHLLNGRIPDIYGVIRDVFKADYVLCHNPQFADLLNHEAGFKKIYPRQDKPDDQSMARLYAVDESRSRTQVLSFEGHWGAKEDDAEVQGKAGKSWQIFGVDPQMVQKSMSAFVDFRALETLIPESNPSTAQRCVTLRPATLELERHQGAQYLGLGLSSPVRVWRNGVKIYDAPVNQHPARMVNVVVSLSPTVSAKDKWQVEVCGEPHENRGFAISFWTAMELETICPGRVGERKKANEEVPDTTRKCPVVFATSLEHAANER